MSFWHNSASPRMGGFALLTFLMLCGTLQAFEIDSLLQEQFRSKSRQTLKAIVQFHSPTRSDDHAFLATEDRITQRRKTTRERETRFLNFTSDRRGRNTNLRSAEFFWINDSAVIEANEAFFRALKDNPEVKYVGRDRRFKLLDSTDKGDVSLQNRVKMAFGIRQINANLVWQYLGLTGAGVKVGILDTGWSDHPEIRSRVTRSRDFVSSFPDDSPNDDHGHGSHCMGIIGGGDLSGQAIGVAPDISYIVGKIFSDLGYTHESIILKAMQWIADPDGDSSTDDFPRIVSNSWGNPRGTDKEEKPIWDAVKTWRDLGIVPIFAAGNSGPGKASMSSPASYPHSIAVGSTNRWRFIHRSSSRGPAQWGGQEFLKPDVVAPGVSILSLDYKGDYTKKTGTSMAAPHVAGIAALMLQARPNLTVDRVADLLRESASQGFQASANNKYGFGLVRAYGALMHLFRENEILLRVNSGDAIASVFVEPYQVRYWTNPKGEVHIFLPEGKYEITANAFGFEPQEFKIKLEKKEKVFKAITLEKAKRYSVEFFVFSPERIPVESSLEFLRTPLPIQNTTGGSLRLKMPEGEYEVLIRSRGYLPLKQEFKIKKKDDFEIELSHLPDVFVVDDDYLNQSEEIYSQSLDESGLSFQSQKNEDGIDRLLMMSFERAIWYTGSTGLNTLTPRDRDLIMDYVRSGGNLILTGQDIGFEIGISKFYRNFLGVEFLKDHADSLKVRFQDQIVDLTEGDNIHYPRSLDVFKPTTASAQVLMTYENGSVAAIINKYDKGKLIYLGFGFEAVQGIAARKKLMQSLMTQLQPSIQERLQRISWAYHNNAELHSILVEKFKPRTQREKKISQKFLESFPQKAPFRAIISNLLHEN